MLPFDSGAMMNSLLETGQPRHRVGPRPQAVPRPGQGGGLGLAQREPELGQQAVERHAVEAIEGGPRQFAGAYPVHARRILRPPRIGERPAVDGLALLPGQRPATCVATEARQSTTVPNTSKTSALTGSADVRRGRLRTGHAGRLGRGEGAAVTAPTAAPRKRRREHPPGGQSTAMVGGPPAPPLTGAARGCRCAACTASCRRSRRASACPGRRRRCW